MWLISGTETWCDDDVETHAQTHYYVSFWTIYQMNIKFMFCFFVSQKRESFYVFLCLVVKIVFRPFLNGYLRRVRVICFFVIVCYFICFYLSFVVNFQQWKYDVSLQKTTWYNLDGKACNLVGKIFHWPLFTTRWRQTLL